MKIYINNFNLTIIKELQNTLQPYFISSENYNIVLTNEGIFKIGKNEIYKLDPVDIDIKLYKNYFEDFTLIMDQSYFNETKVSSIYGIKHLSKNIKKNIYKLNNKSNIKLVIETTDALVNDIYFELNNNIKDINELFIKHEIIEFLLLLN